MTEQTDFMQYVKILTERAKHVLAGKSKDNLFEMSFGKLFDFLNQARELDENLFSVIEALFHKLYYSKECRQQIYKEISALGAAVDQFCRKHHPGGKGEKIGTLDHYVDEAYLGIFVLSKTLEVRDKILGEIKKIVGDLIMLHTGVHTLLQTAELICHARIEELEESAKKRSRKGSRLL